VGAVGLDGDALYYAYPNENAIRSVDVRDRRESDVPLPEYGYRPKPYPFDGRDDINLSFFDKRMQDYALKNSRTEGARVLADYVLGIRADGEMPVEEGEFVPLSRQRERKYFVYGKDHRLVDVVPLDFQHMRMLGYSETGVWGNSLYFVVQASPDGGKSVTWTLLEMEMQEQ
jgi:hypothetical protein